MKVLLIGGSGYLGRRMTEMLVERGDEVTVVSRGNLQPSVLGSVRTITVDRKDQAAFERAFEGETFDAAIDNIAYNADDIGSIVKALSGHIDHYVFISSMAVYRPAETPTPWLEDAADLNYVPDPNSTDTGHPTQGHSYAIGKRQAELALQRQQAFEQTAIRAPIVVASDDRTRRIWWFVQRILDGGPIITVDWGPGRIFQVVYADDVAQAAIKAIGNDRAYGKAYNVAQPELFDADTWTASMFRGLDREPRIVRIPEPMLAQVGLGAYSLPIAGRPLGNYRVDISAARRDLDYVPTPFPQWMETTVRDCAGNPPADDSADYEHRAREIAAAEAFAAVQAQLGELAAAQLAATSQAT
jgi:nucleoside-diphosphate-sugar epimerase